MKSRTHTAGPYRSSPEEVELWGIRRYRQPVTYDYMETVEERTLVATFSSRCQAEEYARNSFDPSVAGDYDVGELVVSRGGKRFLRVSLLGGFDWYEISDARGEVPHDPDPPSG